MLRPIIFLNLPYMMHKLKKVFLSFLRQKLVEINLLQCESFHAEEEGKVIISIENCWCLLEGTKATLQLQFSTVFH